MAASNQPSVARAIVDRIPVGHKFAIAALDRAHTAFGLQDPMELEPGVFATGSFPFRFSEFWKSTLGEQVQQADNAGLCLTAVASSRRPGIIDDENENLQKQVGEWYYAILLAGPFFSHGKSFGGTGANTGEGPEFRSSSEYPFVVQMQGTAGGELTAEIADRAQRLVPGIRAMGGKNAYSRIWRMTHRFLDGLRQDEIGERIQLLVRVVEGLILPRKGGSRDDFADRVPMFIDGVARPDLELLYDVQSSVSHLHGPFAPLPDLPGDGKAMELLRLAILVEAMAREILAQIFLRPEMWAFFEDAQTWEQMWGQYQDLIPGRWGTRIDLRSRLVGFDEKWIDRDSLAGWR